MKALLTATLAMGLFFAGCSSKQDVQTSNNSNTNLMDGNQVQEEVLTKSTNLTVDTTSVYFDFDKYSIKNDMKDEVNTNKENIKTFLQKYNTFTISVNGHCDNRGTDEYNYALGLKRAQVVKAELTKAGVSEKNIVTKSFGESSPVCMANTEECWAKNRRVDFTLR